jgi:hypothetical protein
MYEYQDQAKSRNTRKVFFQKSTQINRSRKIFKNQDRFQSNHAGKKKNRARYSNFDILDEIDRCSLLGHSYSFVRNPVRKAGRKIHFCPSNKFEGLRNCISLYSSTSVNIFCSSPLNLPLFESLDLKTKFLTNKIFLKPSDFISLANNKNCSIILLKILESDDELSKMAIFTKICLNFSECAKNQYGYFLIRKIFEIYTPIKRKSLLNIVSLNLKDLIDHKYGYYLLNTIFEHGLDQEKRLIADSICDKMSLFLTPPFHRNRCNLIKAYVLYGDGNHVNFLLNFLEISFNHEYLIMHQMARDQYGNYVLQYMLDVIEDKSQKEFLILNILKKKKKLKNNQFARYVITKIKNKYKGIYSQHTANPIIFE